MIVKVVKMGMSYYLYTSGNQLYDHDYLLYSL